MRQISAKAACVQFLPRHNMEHMWKDYILIDWNDDDRCRSHVGRRGGQQKLSIGFSCLNFGTILHELMHVLGFHHEHSRPDRDEYLDILWENIDPDNWHNFQIMERSQFRNVTEFDYNSIMMYGEYSFSDNGKPTMVPRNPRVLITGPKDKKALSHLDIYALQQLYCH